MQIPPTPMHPCWRTTHIHELPGLLLHGTLDAQAVSGDPAEPPPTGVPHLMSPDNLAPGTTTDAAVGCSQTPRLFRLRELWDAMHTDGLSLSEALPLLAQRPLDANAVPRPGVSAGPQPPPTEPLPPTP